MQDYPTISFTDFQNNMKEHIERMKRSGEPELLSIEDDNVVIIQDAESYQALIDKIDFAESVVGIRSGLEDVKNGLETDANEFFDSFQQKHQIPKKI